MKRHSLGMSFFIIVYRKKGGSMKKRTRVMAILLACMLTASTILPAVNVYAEEPDMQKTDEMTEKITERDYHSYHSNG